MKNSLLILLLLPLSHAVFAQTQAKDLEGAWQGTLDAGGQKLRLAVTVTKSDAGAYAGKLDSLDQGATIPIDTITVTVDAVRLEVKSLNSQVGQWMERFNHDSIPSFPTLTDDDCRTIQARAIVNSVPELT